MTEYFGYECSDKNATFQMCPSRVDGTCPLDIAIAKDAKK